MEIFSPMATDWHKIRVTGHFGEFLQGRLGADGPVTLITLPCPNLGVRVMHRTARDFRLHTPQRLLSRTKVRRVFKLLGRSISGHIVLQSEMPPGGGAGASTSVILGLLRLLSRDELLPEQEAQLCLMIEGASDPVMHENCDRLLWASRDGVAIKKIPGAPDFEIIGGFGASTERTDARDRNFAQINDLIDPWVLACQSNDRVAAGAISSISATRNAKKRGQRQVNDLLALAKAMGAHGIVTAHTGSACGLLFTPGKIPTNAGQALRKMGMRTITQFRIQRTKR